MDLIEKNNNENRHPWELSRVESLVKEINKYHTGGNILDIGCGDSYFDYQLLEKNQNIDKLYGIDIYTKDEFKDGKYIVTNNYDKLKNKKFDTIVILDVIEHIDNDYDFLENTVKPLLNKNGKIIITVPAYQFLFGKHDIELKHYRRYNHKMIKDICNKGSFKIKQTHYFYASLVLPRLIFKISNKDNKINNWKYNKNHWLTRLLKEFLNLDYLVCKKMNKLSFGLSLFIVLEQK